MAYRSRSTRRIAKKSKQRLFTTIIIILGLFYVTLNWVLPGFIGGLGLVTDIFKGHKGPIANISDNPNLAPPVLSIPYEATNSARIDIRGFATTNSKVKLYLDDNLIDTINTKEDGSFISRNVTLSLGTNNIYGKTEDDKGMESLASKTIRLIYDNDRPNLDVSAPSDGQTFSGERRINVIGKTEPDTTVTVNGDQAIVDSNGNFNKQISLSDGNQSITITSRDLAGNSTTISKNVTFNP